MLPPDLSAVLANLLEPSGGDAGPSDVLPSMPMASMAPAPVAMPGSTQPPMPVPAGHPGGAPNLIRDLAPILIAAATGIRNPIHGAAMAQGYATGAHAALTENMAEEQRAEQKRVLAGHFLQQTAADVLRLKDPLERQQYLKLAEELGVQQFGMAPGWTAKIPAHGAGDDQYGTLKAELAAKLQAFDKDKKWASVAGTPGEAKISFKLSNGQSVPVNMARQLVGQAMYDTASGSQAFAALPVEGKTEQERAAALLAAIRTAKNRGDTTKAADLQAQYDDLKQAKRDTEKPPTVPVGSFEDYLQQKFGPRPTASQIESARRTYGDAGRAEPAGFGGPGSTSGALDPDGLAYAATLFRLTNQMPALGMGKNPDRGRIINSAAAQAKALGQSPAAAIQRTALYKADAKSLDRITMLGSTAEAAEQKASGQIEIIRDLSTKVPRTQYPILNRAVLSGQTEIAGDPNATALINAISTFANEYGKIIEGSTGSVSGSSDAARRAAGRLVSAAMNPKQLATVLDLMQREMDLTLQGYDVTKTEITKRMGGTVPETKPPIVPPVPRSTTPTQIGRFTVTVGGGQ